MCVCGGEADSVHTAAKRRSLEGGADPRKWKRRKRAVPQNEAGAPENRIVVLRTCPDAPSRNLHPVLGPVVTALAGTLPFLSGSDTYGTLKGLRSPRRVPAIGPALHNVCTIICRTPGNNRFSSELPARRTRESNHLHYALSRNRPDLGQFLCSARVPRRRHSLIRPTRNALAERPRVTCGSLLAIAGLLLRLVDDRSTVRA